MRSQIVGDPRIDASPDRDPVGPLVLHRVFETVADKQPRAIAIECGSQRMTYAQLDAQANQLARYLRSRGIGREMLVALVLPRSFESLVALLATSKAGAAYVPIDPESPPERTFSILEECGAPLLLTSTALSPQRIPSGCTAVCLEDAAHAIDRNPDDRLEPGDRDARAEDLCYVIHTSGTTGRPKGVAIEHRSVCHLIETEARIFGLTPLDRVHQGFSLAFDAAVEEIWLAFRAGATLVCAVDTALRAGPDLSRHLREARITVLSAVPTMLTTQDDDAPDLRLLILGGEHCPADLVRRWWRPERRVVNTYGPTETTVIATIADCRPDLPVTIGRAIPGYDVHVLDTAMRPVPCGEVGEIYIGGIGLAREYLGRPDLTRERFVVGPFAPPGDRLYRTGDLARLAPSGDIEILGRADDQWKVRGFRIEPAEIEAALQRCEGVAACCVAIREDLPGIQDLVGYVVEQAGWRISARALRTRLKLALPPYMVPARIVEIDALPLLPSGKLDRSALPAPRAAQETGREIHSPRSALERRILASWERLFSPTRVSIDDDFFVDLGGHSLLAAAMVSQLRATPGLQTLSVSDIYRCRTVRAIANHMRTCAPARPAAMMATAARKAPEAAA